MADLISPVKQLHSPPEISVKPSSTQVELMEWTMIHSLFHPRLADFVYPPSTSVSDSVFAAKKKTNYAFGSAPFLPTQESYLNMVIQNCRRCFPLFFFKFSVSCGTCSDLVSDVKPDPSPLKARLGSRRPLMTRLQCVLIGSLPSLRCTGMQAKAMEKQRVTRAVPVIVFSFRYHFP